MASTCGTMLLNHQMRCSSIAPLSSSSSASSLGRMIAIRRLRGDILRHVCFGCLGPQSQKRTYYDKMRKEHETVQNSNEDLFADMPLPEGAKLQGKVPLGDEYQRSMPEAVAAGDDLTRCFTPIMTLMFLFGMYVLLLDPFAWSPSPDPASDRSSWLFGRRVRRGCADDDDRSVGDSYRRVMRGLPLHDDAPQSRVTSSSGAQPSDARP